MKTNKSSGQIIQFSAGLQQKPNKQKNFNNSLIEKNDQIVVLETITIIRSSNVQKALSTVAIGSISLKNETHFRHVTGYA